VNYLKNKKERINSSSILSSKEESNIQIYIYIINIPELQRCMLYSLKKDLLT